MKNTNTNAVLDSYSYDGVGNRTGTALGSVVSARYYNIDNQYSNVGYNGDGDVTNDGTFTYAWDTNDHLIGVTPNSPVNGSEQEQMSYDGQGRMISQTIQTYNATTSAWVTIDAEHFLWDGTNMTAILDGNNQLLEEFTYGPTGRIAETDFPADPNNPDPGAGPTTYIILSDASQNEIGLVNETTGAMAASVHYAGPFGENMTVTGPAAFINQFGFAGGWTDSITDLVYFDNRWYSPAQGRFMSEDPAGISGGTDLYTYAGNDPIKNFDPSGLSIQLSNPGNILDTIAPAGYSYYGTTGGVAGGVNISTANSSGQNEFDAMLNDPLTQIAMSSTPAPIQFPRSPPHAPTLRVDSPGSAALDSFSESIVTPFIELGARAADFDNDLNYLTSFGTRGSSNQNLSQLSQLQHSGQTSVGMAMLASTPIAGNAYRLIEGQDPLTSQPLHGWMDYTGAGFGLVSDGAFVTAGGMTLAGVDISLTGGTNALPTTDVTEAGIQQIEQHLSRPEIDALDDPGNSAMIDRLRAGNTTPQDMNFYNHELYESSLMDEGLGARDAHLQTLQWQGIPYEAGYEAQLYHPSVIQQFPEYFNPASHP